jgi:hypothetical protein
MNLCARARCGQASPQSHPAQKLFLHRTLRHLFTLARRPDEMLAMLQRSKEVGQSRTITGESGPGSGRPYPPLRSGRECSALCFIYCHYQSMHCLLFRGDSLSAFSRPNLGPDNETRCGDASITVQSVLAPQVSKTGAPSHNGTF